jgi:predicted transcriptional regulator
MDTSIILELNEKLKKLPNSNAHEIEVFIDYLSSDNEADWYDSISEQSKKSIAKGLNDLHTGKTISHQEAMQIISQRLNK